MKLLRKIRLYLAALVVAVSALFMLGLPAYAADSGLFNGVCPTNPKDPAYNSSVCVDARNQGKNNPVAGQNGILNKVTLILSTIGAIAAVILIVLSGLTMVTSAGNSEKVASARRRIIYAIVGLVVIGVSNLIVNFVIDNFV